MAPRRAGRARVGDRRRCRRRSPALTAADARTAERNLADALLGQGLLTREQAACTAREWIAAAGLRRLVEDGLFDADLRFVDVPASRLSEATRSAAATATVTCATS